MDAELNTLEEKISQLVELCQRLRAENLHLRQQLVATTDQNKQLTDKISGAQNRLESLLQQIPENEE
jgi:cell division protein ZapB